jgi:hypothetical protein
VTFSPEQYWRNNIALSGERIIGNTNQGLAVWNLQTAELEAILDKEQMSNLVISPDGKLLAGITWDSDNHATKIKVLKRPGN